MNPVSAHAQWNRPLVLLLAVFVGLALFYSVSIPLFEGPDEDDHFRLVRFIADRRALPVQEFVTGGGTAGHQGWQPPLYYALAAVLISPLDTSDFSQHLWRNNNVTFVGDPACCGRNIYFHTAAENFPYTGTTLAVHLARLLSIFFGALTVWATFTLVQTLAPFWPTASPLLPLAAAALVAFNPSFLFSSALVSNDAMLAALSALVLLSWVRLLTGRSTPGLRTALWLGGLLAAAVLTKTTALGLVAFSVVILLWAGWRRGVLLQAIKATLVLLAMVVELAGWWFVRNQVLYGDPLAYRLMTVSATFPRSGPLTPEELFQISLPWLWQTFWGGPTPGDFSPILLVILAVLAALAAAGMFVLVIRIGQSSVRTVLLVLTAWLAFILVAQVQFIRTTIGADQGRYLFPAIGVIALALTAGLTELVRLLVPARPRILQMAHFAIALFAFLLAAWVPFAYTLPAYAQPALLTGDDLRITHPVEATFAGQFQLLGYDLDTRIVKPGDILRVTLYWRALAPMPESYRVFVHLIGQNNVSAGGTDVIPARGAFPTVYWKPGDTLRDVVQVPVGAGALPGKYSIEVGLYPAGQVGERLVVSGSGDDRVVLEAIKVAPRQAVTYTPQVRADADFGGNARLMGYDAALDSQSLILHLYWESKAPMERDYTVFVHVLDADGQVAGQADQEPQAGNAPTFLWQTGEQIRDDYVIPLPPGGPYRVELGLYRQDTGERLPVRAGGSAGDHFEFTLPGAAR